MPLAAPLAWVAGIPCVLFAYVYASSVSSYLTEMLRGGNANLDHDPDGQYNTDYYPIEGALRGE
jgi:hypothetical protein